MASTEIVIKTVSVSVALLGAGGIAALSLFDVPELQSQPASRSLPSIRWLFSRGSHIFPQAAAISSAGFAYLAYDALPLSAHSMLKTNGYLAAAGLALSIAPFTAWIMIPTNFALIKKNEEKGGFRSNEASRQSGSIQKGGRSALDSVRGQNEGREFTDFCGPQGQTMSSTNEQDDKEVRELLAKFGMMNMVRALLLSSGGVIGLVTALL